MKFASLFHKRKTKPYKDHTILISMLKNSDGYLYSMTIDFINNAFCVVRSKYDSDSERIRSEYIDYDIFNSDEKALFDRYDKFDFLEGDRERFEALPIAVFNKYVLGHS